MTWRQQMNDKGVITQYKDSDTGEILTAAQFEQRMQAANGMAEDSGSLTANSPAAAQPQGMMAPAPSPMGGMTPSPMGGGMAPSPMAPAQTTPTQGMPTAPNPLIQPGAQMIAPGSASNDMLNANPSPMPQGMVGSPLQNRTTGLSPTAGLEVQGKSLRLEGVQKKFQQVPVHHKTHGFLDATSIAILLPTLVLLALIIAAAHKKRLFPWQTIRTFNPPSGLMTPRDYERSYLCPPNLRRHGRLGKRNPSAAWTDADGVVLPFGFLARTHLPVTIPLGRLPNKNMFLVAPSGSGKTTLMRAIIKALLAKPCVIIALEAKANDPNLDEKREGFKFTVLPEAEHAGFSTLYFNPLDQNSIHWNPLDLDAISFASSIVQDVNSLPPEEQHWAERDHGYITGLAQLLKWGAIQVAGEDENGQPSEIIPLPCNPRGLMRLVNNRRNIVESLRRLKQNPEVDAGELSELTQTLTSIIRTDSDWDKNIQGVRGRLRMFKNPNVLRVTERSNVDIKTTMHEPTVLIFGAPASLGPDAESLASCFVYQLQQALHTRYGTNSVLPLFAFFDEYQTLNIDLAGRLSAIVRGANGGLTVILQNISQISGGGGKTGDAAGSGSGGSEIKTIFSNSAVRVCLHNADETTAKFFSEEIGKHAVVVPGISDHYMANGFGIFPTSWNRIHSQQVVARVDTDSIKRMEKHHALVYLSPAGDPEYGEVKPLMVDLRGIEEIARMHLLHNVSARRGPDGEMVENPAPDFAQPTGGMDMPAAMYGGPGAGAGDAQQQGFGYDQGNAGGYGHEATPQYDQAVQYAENAYAQPAYTQSQSGSFVQPELINPQYQSGGYQAQQPESNGVRTCPLCVKPAGKGKFCIECGQFIGAPAAGGTESGAYAQMSTSAQIVEPAYAGVGASTAAAAQPDPNAPPFPSFARSNAAQIADAQNPYGQAQQPVAAGVGQRQPVTSFNLDPSKMGFAQPLSQQANQQPGGRRNNNLEF
ncbi:MAG TPA: type IV secretory system conjugative DNA transfer family protein [Oculatellaceae cyanobacterium]